MKKEKKLLAILLVSLLLAVTVLSGCGSPKGGTVSPSNLEITPPPVSSSNLEVTPPPAKTELTAEEARAKVLEKVPYATTENFTEFEADYDDGRKEYEGTLVYGKMACEFEIDAETGEFRDWEVDNFSDCIRCN